MKIINTLIILLILTGVGISETLNTLPALHPQQIRRFADFLFDTERYDDALHEYQRLQYSGYTNNNTEYTIGLCYLHAHHFTQATEHFKKIFETSIDLKMSTQALHAYAYSLYAQHKHSACLSVINKPAFSSKKLHSLLSIMCYAHLHDWDNAQSSAQIFSKTDISHGSRIHTSIIEIIESARSPRTKSPILAGSLALIPGLGNFYLGKFSDGFYSFIIIAGSYLSAYTAHSYKSDLATYGAGGFGVVMHVGNIFGSASAAKALNTKSKQTYILQLQTLFDTHALFNLTALPLTRK